MPTLAMRGKSEAEEGGGPGSKATILPESRSFEAPAGPRVGKEATKGSVAMWADTVLPALPRP